MPHAMPRRDAIVMPRIGLGTWRMGEQPAQRGREVAALRTAVALGYRMIDSAEMYGEGGAEQVVGQALADALRVGEVQRNQLFIVSKVYPHNATRDGVAAACERSLRRLGLDCIDLYLLHWRGAVPLAETVDAMRTLVQRGHIRAWGVSNFDRDDLLELEALAGDEAAGCAANQVYYSLTARGVEFDLLAWQAERGMPLMAYSPIDQGALAGERRLAAVAARHGATPAQIALARLLAEPGVVVIPKAVQPAHLRANFEAASLLLTPQDIAEIDRLFPPPRRATPLAMR